MDGVIGAKGRRMGINELSRATDKGRFNGQVIILISIPFLYETKDDRQLSCLLYLLQSSDRVTKD